MMIKKTANKTRYVFLTQMDMLSRHKLVVHVIDGLHSVHGTLMCADKDNNEYFVNEARASIMWTVDEIDRTSVESRGTVFIHLKPHVSRTNPSEWPEFEPEDY